MRFARVASALVIGLLAFGGGCARYEYDLVEPAEHARHIGRGIDQSVEIEPITYRLRTVDNRLVMRAYNNSDEPIELLGEKSSVVDPQGQSHPLQNQTIAPKSFIKLIFPPPRPHVYDYGPTFGVGVGYGMRVENSELPDRSAFHTHYPAYEPYFRNSPHYISVYDEANSFYWDWKGGGEARVNLVYQQGERELRHAFVFRRVKM